MLRGEEWLPSTPKHELLYHAFGWAKPAWAHLPLLLGPDGSKLSKRRGNAATIAELREKGYLPAALVHSLVLCGWAPQELETKHTGIAESSSGNADVSSVDMAHQTGLLTLEGLSNSITPHVDALGHDPEQTRTGSGFSLDRVQRAAARLDPVKLDVLNGRFLRAELCLIDSHGDGAVSVAATNSDVALGEEKLVDSAVAARERLLSTLRLVFARAVLESSSNNDRGNQKKVEQLNECRSITAALPFAVESALLQWAGSAKKDAGGGFLEWHQPANTAKIMHWLLIEGKVDDYLLQVAMLLQKQANGPLQDLAQEHAGYFFGHIREQPQFKCKAALASAVIGTMDTMATVLEDQQATPENSQSPLAATDMQHTLKAALARWNKTYADPGPTLKQGQFMPQVRMAATGKGTGADLFPILTLLGPECVASRLRLGAAALRHQTATG